MSRDYITEAREALAYSPDLAQVYALIALAQQVEKLVATLTEASRTEVRIVSLAPPGGDGS